jgi:hypothetical protein
LLFRCCGISLPNRKKRKNQTRNLNGQGQQQSPQRSQKAEEGETKNSPEPPGFLTQRVQIILSDSKPVGRRFPLA